MDDNESTEEDESEHPAQKNAGTVSKPHSGDEEDRFAIRTNGGANQR